MKGTQIGMKIAVNHVLPALFYVFRREESVLDYQKLAYALLRVIATYNVLGHKLPFTKHRSISHYKLKEKSNIT